MELHIPLITVEEAENIEEQLVEILQQRNLTITTAESCTAGLICGRLVNVPGVSEWLQEAHITYSNEAKHRLLGVSNETLEAFGAVSSQTVQEMAGGAARIADADIAIAVTGIAGPDGATPKKPVGLVYIGCCVFGTVFWQEYHFSGSRMEVREQTVVNALRQVQYVLQNEI